MSRLFCTASLLFAVASVSAIAYGQSNVNEGLETAFLWVDVAKGSDSNSGTNTSPYKTIGKAVTTAVGNRSQNIGTKVTVNPGVYRESLNLTKKADPSALPITIQAAITGTAFVSGAVQFMGWAPSSGNPSIFTTSWPNKFGTCSADPNGPSAPEIVLRREMIFVNGFPLTQVLTLASMVQSTFYVDDANGKVYLWPPSGTDLSSADVEVATNPSLLQILSQANVVVRGMTFEYANNCRTAPPGVQVAGSSSNILFDTDSFLWNNGSAIGVFQSAVNFTVQNSAANHNGRSGFVDYRAKSGLWLNDQSSYNNWRGAQGTYYFWGSSGDYFYSEHDGTVNGMILTFNQTNGIHWDTDNANITATNVFAVQNLLNGMFVEADEGPVSISSSTMCGNAVAGTSQMQYDGGLEVRNSESVTLTGSTLYNNGHAQVDIQGQAGGLPVTNWETGQNYTLVTENLTLSNNVIAAANTSQVVFSDSYLDGSDWSSFSSTLSSSGNNWWNSANVNVFITPDPKQGTKLDFSQWQSATAQDLNGSTFSAPSINLTKLCSIAPDFPDYWLLSNQPSVTLGTDGTASFVVTSQPVGAFSGNQTLTLDGISEVPGLSGSLNPTTIATGGNSTLSVNATTGVASGTYPLTVIANSGSITRTSTFLLVVPETQLRITPGSINFPSQQAGTTSAPIAVTVSNASTTSISMGSVVASDHFGVTNNCNTTLGPGQNCILDVTFSPNAKGSFIGTLTINDSAPSSPQVINLTGSSGGAPYANLSPGNLHFGQQKISTKSAAKVVTLTNKGSGTLNIGGISLAGTNPGEFLQTNTCGSTLAAGANCTINVTFRPTKTGSRVATLQVADNQSNSPQSVALAGTGTTR